MIETPSPSTILPMTEAFSPVLVRMSMTFCASFSSTASTMPMPILYMLNISR